MLGGGGGGGGGSLSLGAVGNLGKQRPQKPVEGCRPALLGPDNEEARA